MKKETFVCDIKNCKNTLDKEDLDKSIQVIFTTEQTEGRSCKPYLSIEKLDICKSCLDKVLQGNYIFAYGAMGYNDYVININSNIKN